MPLLVRGVAIELRVTKLFMYLRVNPLYELKLCLPRIAEIDSEMKINEELKLRVEGLFDCKDRRCLVFFPLECKEEVIEAAEEKEEDREEEDVDEDLFGDI